MKSSVIYNTNILTGALLTLHGYCLMQLSLGLLLIVSRAILLICVIRPTANINGSYRYAITLVNTAPSTPLSRRPLSKLPQLCSNGYIIIFTRVFGRAITAQNSKAPFLYCFGVIEL